MRELETSIGRVGLIRWDDYTKPGSESMIGLCEKNGYAAVLLIGSGVDLEGVSLEEVEIVVAAMPDAPRYKFADLLAANAETKP